MGPAHELSQDGNSWMPASHLPELEMDSVAEISSGALYGPIHRNALEELVRDGSIPKGVKVYRQVTLTGATPPVAKDDEHKTSRARMLEAQQALVQRIEELESSLRDLSRSRDEAQAALEAKDLEFEAERRDFQAADARTQAERIKRERTISTLEKSNREMEEALKGRHALEQRVAELLQEAETLQDSHKTQIEAQRASFEADLTKAREEAQSAKQDLSELRKASATQTAEFDQLSETVRGLRLREQSVRRLLQQALGAASDESEPIDEAIPTEVAAPGLGGATRSAPMTVSTLGSAQGSMALADLEAQARRELQHLHSARGGLAAFMPQGNRMERRHGYR